MVTKKVRTFTVAGKTYNALGVYAVTPTKTGVVVRWAHGDEEEFDGITSQEILFKIEEAKSSADR